MNDGLPEGPLAEQGSAGVCNAEGTGRHPCAHCLPCSCVQCPAFFGTGWKSNTRARAPTTCVMHSPARGTWELSYQPQQKRARCFLAQPLSGKEEKQEPPSLPQTGDVSVCISSFPGPARSSWQLSLRAVVTRTQTGLESAPGQGMGDPASPMLPPQAAIGHGGGSCLPRCSWCRPRWAHSAASLSGNTVPWTTWSLLPPEAFLGALISPFSPFCSPKPTGQ